MRKRIIITVLVSVVCMHLYGDMPRSESLQSASAKTVQKKVGRITISNRTLDDLFILIKDANMTILTKTIEKKKVVDGFAALPAQTSLTVLYKAGTALPLHVCLWEKKAPLGKCDWSDYIGSEKIPLENDEWDISGSIAKGLHISRTTGASRKEFFKKKQVGNPPSLPLR